MNRVCLAAVILAASSGVASAGTYLGLGIGTGPAIGNDSESTSVMLESSGRSMRGMLGYRFGNLAVEGAVGGFDLTTYEARQASVSGKLHLPIGDGFEAFGRLGLQRTWLNSTEAGRETFDVSGDGYLVGAGVEYRLKLPIGATSIWMDYQYSNADVEGARFAYEVSARMWTLGLSVGL